MKICVFDTETTSLDKPFCYNVGFILCDTEKQEILCKEEYCIEQTWHNLPLFSSAYYADKRPIYVNRMRAKKIVLEKWGYVTQRMARLFKLYEIECAFAYNSPFDEKVFDFNCEWFKTINPFDNIPILDIRGYVHQFIATTPAFHEWCEENGAFTESGNFSTTAETLYRYVTGMVDFEEEHTALADSEIELFILLETVDRGAILGEKYTTFKSIERIIPKTLTVKDKDGHQHLFDYEKIKINKDKTFIRLS